MWMARRPPPSTPRARSSSRQDRDASDPLGGDAPRRPRWLRRRSGQRRRGPRGRCRERAPELAREAVATLGARLGQATTPGDTASYLRALGNAAAPEVLALVEPFLDDPRVGVRAAAVDALRRVPGGRVDAALARALRDAERSVRSEGGQQRAVSAGALVG